MNDGTILTAARAHLETTMRMIEEDTRRYKVNCEVCIILDDVTFGMRFTSVILCATNIDTLKATYFSVMVLDNPPPDQTLHNLEFAGPLEFVVNKNTEIVDFKRLHESFDFWGRYDFGKSGIRMPSTTRFCIAEMIAEQLK